MNDLVNDACDRCLVGDQGFYLIHPPDVVLVREVIQRLSGFGIALIGQFVVTLMAW